MTAPKLSRHNNFDAIRILAAAAVIFGHAHPLTRSAEVVVLGNSVQALAVKVFFVVSGFLIATSWQLDPNPVRYLRKRALRIFPGLAWLLALSVLVLGPVLTTQPLGAYFTDGGTWRYFWSNLLLNPVYALGGLFPANPYPNAVNGSLWSLPVEFLMYLVMPCVLAFARIGGNAALFVAFSIGLAVASLFALRTGHPPPTQVYYGTGLASVLDVAPYFFLGSLFAVTSLYRILNTGFALFLVGLFAFFQPSAEVAKELALYIVLPVAVLSLGVANTPYLNRAGRFGDFSYGLYLYGFVLQQAFLFFFPMQSALQNAACALVASFVLAWISWHLVEAPALRLKKKRVALQNIQAQERT
ncbi:MAG: acyltransferase [Proteobacteria bacterium]|nr:acyltransferase [Pseudomonadota bacterium]MBS0216717.1 acyltransferase [Pseudomonadota bacterium]